MLLVLTTLGDRKPDDKNRANPLLRPEGQRSAVAVDHRGPCQRQALTSAPTDLFGRKERVEYARVDGGGDAMTGISDLDHEVIALQAGFDGKCAPPSLLNISHGVS